jgi:NitT/TauT family transport system substrate-binding protein
MTTKIKWLSCMLLGLFITACTPATPAIEPVTIRVGYSSSLDMADIPSLLANEALVKQGYIVEAIPFAEAELVVEALAGGDVDIASGSVGAYWTAIHKGAPIVTVMAHARNEWAIISTPDIQQCADLDGKRIAVNSEGSISTIMLKVYVRQTCPEIEPIYLTIGGSDNRAAAMLAGEVEAAPLEVADVIQMDLKAPGQFHTLLNFSQELPKLESTVLNVNTAFAAEHPQAVKDYLEAVLLTYRAIYDDPAALTAEAEKNLSIEADLLPRVIDAEFAIHLWDVNGGLTPESAQFTLDFFTASGDLEPGLILEQVIDFSYLDTVLAKIGRK